MKVVDPIIAADLDAYIDGELDVTRRIQVESYLSENPETAAKVMADLSMRGELRLALADEGASGRAETRDVARRLERGLAYGRIFHVMQRVAAVAVLVGAGWVAHTSFGAFTATEVAASVPAPAYVEDAVQAYKTTLVRQAVSSPRSESYKPDEIRAATGIVMPQLPSDWTISDVQIFPSEFGPSVEMSIVADNKQLSLFAVRPGVFSVQSVNHIGLNGAEASYWQIGDVAYALVTADRSITLDQAADRLARTLY
ncbi:anti-sigma factor family protein [Rhizobium metallidurans]|uniref:Anti-sigma factor RsiW n=1 Tax=Rhizobium metallidurans TaxID=1265931 RepID=A0A7W6CN80_9HYPH|nr:anti-sigma factor [Rhizobium metallidurans]MBB3963119.1 anti-sigma factor RsiW [Rhizobium metallidurans]